jgi:putative ABC transport system permease protein
VLLGAVAFVLLITCANTGNLFLSQMAIRQREMAIRTAIGARRGRLLREVLTESILLALCGGAVGMLFATWGVDGLLAAAPENLTFQATSPIEIDNRILAVTATMTLATGLLFGLVPAFRGSRPQVDLILKGSGGTGGRGAYSGFNGALVVAEVAFSLILLVGVALMVRTFANLHAIDPGFEPRGVVSLEISVPTDKYPSAGARAAFVESIRDRIRPLPGVSDVALADGVPPSGGSTSYGVAEAEGSDPRSAARELEVIGNTVTPEFFRALRIPLVAGRFFTDADGQHAIVISSSLAARYWPDGTAVGRRFRMLGPDWDTIVGIAGDVEGRIGDDRNLLRI